ncbi:ras-related and estrogen-regulated growth inhibitor [Caerostris extrusa]|uniref:small monomeric GTPase n=1 Tax=Caerostris extrusa TaxID=172846 RepID=A0AAV4W1C6_CAEEX|nr:ras-related and estrogen-regulated growth inhibitor [Caerostris extrusa]
MKVIGKSRVKALTVRFLTKRYIGEYDHQTDSRYKNEVMVDGEPVIFEIIDTCPKSDRDFPKEEIIQWADAFVLAYSIIDKGSFAYVREVRQMIENSRPSSPGGNQGHPAIPTVIMANKADLIHLRQVTAEEGFRFAKDHESSLLKLLHRNTSVKLLMRFMNCAEKFTLSEGDPSSLCWTG